MGLMDTAQSFGLMMVIFLLGIFSAITVAFMYEREIIIDELVTDTLTLGDIMFVIVFVFIIVGLIVMFTRR